MLQSFIFSAASVLESNPHPPSLFLSSSGVRSRPCGVVPSFPFVLVPDRDAGRCSGAPQALGPTTRSRLPSGADLAPRGAAGQSGRRRRRRLVGPLPIKTQPEDYFYTLSIKKGYFVSSISAILLSHGYIEPYLILHAVFKLCSFVFFWLFFFCHSYEMLVFMGVLPPCCHCGLTSGFSLLPTNKLLNCEHL